MPPSWSILFGRQVVGLLYTSELRKFDKKVLMMGYGAVANCTLPLFLKHVKRPYRNPTVIDLEDKAQP
ncbi:MAG: hypothetical protein AB1476_05590 [Candidatus Hadarchaeota archaeon]